MGVLCFVMVKDFKITPVNKLDSLRKQTCFLNPFRERRTLSLFVG